MYNVNNEISIIKCMQTTCNGPKNILHCVKIIPFSKVQDLLSNKSPYIHVLLQSYVIKENQRSIKILLLTENTVEI